MPDCNRCGSALVPEYACEVCGHAPDNCAQLRAERNRLVESTELGQLSEELEGDNMASAATTVRSAMHQIADLRKERDALKKCVAACATEGCDAARAYINETLCLRTTSARPSDE